MQEALWNDEVHAELIEMNLDFKFYKSDDREMCMLEIDKVRRQSMYKHKCYSGCKERGKLFIYLRDIIIIMPNTIGTYFN